MGLRALGFGFEGQHRSDRPQVDDGLRVEMLTGEEVSQRQRVEQRLSVEPLECRARSLSIRRFAS